MNCVAYRCIQTARGEAETAVRKRGVASTPICKARASVGMGLSLFEGRWSGKPGATTPDSHRVLRHWKWASGSGGDISEECGEPSVTAPRRHLFEIRDI